MPIPAEVPLTIFTPSPTVSKATPTIVWFPPTATSTTFPTIIVMPTTDMRPGIEEILFEDHFDEPSDWRLISTDSGSIAFGKNEITIAISSEREYFYSIYDGREFEDFYAEITANPNMCRGDDEYGLLLRVSPNEDYYRYSLSCDGRVRLDRIYQDQASSPQPWITSGAVPPGAPSISRLGIWAHGDEMRFFVNDEYQFTARDPLLTSGKLGVFARSMSEFAVSVNFYDLVVREIQ
jgi:hypothetical protein